MRRAAGVGMRLAAAVGVLIAAVSVAVPGAHAAGEPTVTWSTANGSVVSGYASLSATASATSGYISKWCITQDGVAIASDVAYGGYLDYGTFSAGCWTAPSSYYSITSGTIRFDTTAWTDASHTYQITVTDSSSRVTVSSVLTISTSNPGPTVSWSTANGTVFSGQTSLSATASPAASGTAYIAKWCITRDGVALATDVAYAGYLDYGTFSAGCWTASSSYYSITSGTIRFDTTAWTDGSHTYQITVTDSNNRSATSSVLTMSTSNPGPTVSWTTANNSVVSGQVSLSASASAADTGTAYITKWCIKQDGVAMATDVAYSGYLNYATFSAGCWTASSSYYSITSGTIRFDTTAWTDGAHTYQITVIDSNNRTTTSSVLTVSTSNPRPTATVTGLTNGATVSGSVPVTVQTAIAASSSAYVSSLCGSVNGGSCVSLSLDYSNKANFSLNTQTLKNGSHTLVLKVTDSVKRETTVATISFVTNNTQPGVSDVSRSFSKPTWKDKTVKATVYVTSSFYDSVTVRYGTSKGSLNKSAKSDSSTVNLSGLKPGTKYYFSATVTGKNGTSAPFAWSATSPKIPARPKITSKKCMYLPKSDYSTGATWYEYWYSYKWSDGTSTSSETRRSSTYPC